MNENVKKYLVFGGIAAIVIIGTILTCKPKPKEVNTSNPTSSEVEKNEENKTGSEKNNGSESDKTNTDSNTNNSSSNNSTSTNSNGNGFITPSGNNGNSSNATITPPPSYSSDNTVNKDGENEDIPYAPPVYNNVDVMQDQIVPKETESKVFTDLPEGKTSSSLRHYIDQYSYYERASNNDFAWNPIDLTPLCEQTGDERYRNLYCYNGCLIIDKEVEFGGVTHPEYEHLGCKGIVYIDENGVMPRYIAVGNVSSPYSGGELLLDDGFVDDDMMFYIMNYINSVS